MKPILIAPIIFTALTGLAHAAGYVMDLSGAAINQELVPEFVDSIDGWEQSELNSGADLPKAWINPVGTSTGIGFGPRFDDLSGDPFFINRDVSLGMAGSSLSMSLQLVESSSFPSRNDFFLGLRDISGNSLFTLNFLADPIGFWDLNVNGMSPFGFVSNDLNYELFISFIADGPDIRYNIEFSNTEGLSPPSSSGVIPGVVTDTIGSLDFGVSTGNLSQSYGDNYMTVADVSLIPEPSTSLLSALAMIGLLARRKRA